MDNRLLSLIDNDPLVGLLRCRISVNITSSRTEIALPADAAERLARAIDRSGNRGLRPIADDLRFQLIIGRPVRLCVIHEAAATLMAAVESGILAEIRACRDGRESSGGFPDPGGDRRDP